MKSHTHGFRRQNDASFDEIQNPAFLARFLLWPLTRAKTEFQREAPPVTVHSADGNLDDLDDGTAGTAIKVRGFLSLRRRFFPENIPRVSAEKLKGFGKLGLLARHIIALLSAISAPKESRVLGARRPKRTENNKPIKANSPSKISFLALLIQIERTNHILMVSHKNVPVNTLAKNCYFFDF